MLLQLKEPTLKERSQQKERKQNLEAVQKVLPYTKYYSLITSPDSYTQNIKNSVNQHLS